MKITMDGEYAYRRNPTEQVRILCVDRSPLRPVVSLAKDGNIYSHTENGSFYTSEKEHRYDLVPLEKPPLVVWVVFNKSGEFISAYLKKEVAEKEAKFLRGSVIKLGEVKE